MEAKNTTLFHLEHNISLADYVSWKSGGKAKQLFIPSSLENLQVFLKTLPIDEAILFIGLGSNLLIRDGGFNGTVIFTQKHLRAINLLDNQQIYAECGAACPTLARFAAKHNLVNGEWFAGIPGTVGGALAMNAGAFGGETWERVVSVQCIDHQGELHQREKNDFDVGHRSVITARDEWFVGATFQFEIGDKQTSLDKINQLLDKRAATQPTGVPTCGSVFINPPGNYAGRLIEACGLKGYTIGGAIVSEKHANFIVNTGHATATDIEKLIDYVAATVFAQQGVQLAREVKIVGEPTGF